MVALATAALVVMHARWQVFAVVVVAAVLVTVLVVVALPVPLPVVALVWASVAEVVRAVKVVLVAVWRSAAATPWTQRCW